MAKIVRLVSEWQNRLQADYCDEHGRLISMSALEAALLARKDRISYKRNWHDLATRKLHRHARNQEYVAALLYLLDERTLPVAELQPVIDLQLGHLYRQLKRAGVEFAAESVGIGARLREDYHPFPGALYFDPLSATMLRAGQRVALPASLKIYRGLDEDAENEGEREEILGLVAGAQATVPLPLLEVRKRAVKKPPTLNWRGK